MNKQEIFPKLVDILCQSLNLEITDVTLHSTLINDLGAESIDFLDIIFRVEREFGIKIQRGDLFPENDNVNIQAFNVEMLQDYIYSRLVK